MFPLPEMMIAVLAQFAGLFSAPVWGHAQVLLMGAILCQGPRPVAAILRVMGLGQVKWTLLSRQFFDEIKVASCR